MAGLLNLQGKAIQSDKPDIKVEIPERKNSNNNIRDMGNNNSDTGINADSGELVHCGYDTRILCRAKLDKPSNKEKWGCEACLDAQTRTMVLTMQMKIDTIEKRLINMEAMIQTMMVKILGIPK